MPGDIEKLPGLSVIVPARNAAFTLEACLTAIRDSSLQPAEIIVVDDHSSDDTREVAARLGADVVALERRVGAGAARNAGARKAVGELLVFLDADIVVPRDSLATMAATFARRPEVGALIGCLDGGSPVRGFFSRYKNRYMDFVFSMLPERVDFLYTSVAAVRRTAFADFTEIPTPTEDTELGQRLDGRGTFILYCPQIRVLHLKEHSAYSFFRNNFRVTCSWAQLFLGGSGIRSLASKRRFAHARLRQIAGLLLAAAAALAAGVAALGYVGPWPAVLLAIAALATNADFLGYLGRREGALFALGAGIVSLADQLVMTAGVAAGTARHLARGLTSRGTG